MHAIDQSAEQMVRSVLAYAENRLRLDPVPLDQGTLTAAQLSDPAVARETAKARDGDSTRRRRVVVGTDAHSSISNTLKLLEMDAVVVDTPDHRLTGEAVRAALGGLDDAMLAGIVGVVCTSG